MTQEVDDFLAHFGVKGMKWGVRKESPAGEGKKLSLKDPKVRKAAIVGASITAIAAAAFVASRFSDNPVDASTIAKGAEEAKRIFQQPTDTIYLTKPHKGSGVTKDGLDSTTLRFVSEGGTRDFFEIFDKAGLNSDSFTPGTFKKTSNGDVAAYFEDILGRVDAAGRKIPHTVFIPADKAIGLDSIEDVIEKHGPNLERRYQEHLEKARKSST